MSHAPDQAHDQADGQTGAASAAVPSDAELLAIAADALEALAELAGASPSDVRVTMRQGAAALQAGAARLRVLSRGIESVGADALRYQALRAGLLAGVKHTGIGVWGTAVTLHFGRPPEPAHVDHAVDLLIDRQRCDARDARDAAARVAGVPTTIEVVPR